MTFAFFFNHSVKALVKLLTLVLVFYSLNAGAQSGNTLLGDLRVDESKVTGLKPASYHILLVTASGNVIGRQPTTNNGRYRFLNVQNGEYDIVVQVENDEVARIRVRLMELRPTDVRQDIALEWRPNVGRKNPSASGTVAAVSYNRLPANQSKFDKAMEAIDKKRNDEAMTLLKEIVTDDPKDFIAWAGIGTLQSKQDKNGDAESSYLRALQEKPDYMLALMSLGKLRIAQKNYDGAIEILTRAVATPPPSAEANHLLGECYLQIKKGSKAVGYLNEAIKLDPVGKADVHLRLATLYNGAGMKDRAAIEYEKFLEKKPDYPDKKKLQQYIQENKK
ncbi:MAG: tetratricopeptide repeat protein [Acidobacteriota bacterium]